MKSLDGDENHFLNEKLHDCDTNLNQLKVLDIQEKERSRIARELHDSSLQNFTHLIHMLELSSMFIEKDPIRAKLELESCTQNLRQIISDIRDTVFNLRPMTFDDLGFKQCIQNEIDRLKQQFKDCEISYEIDDVLVSDISEKKEIYNLFLVTLYRIIQEALINSLKHSSADKISLYVKETDKELVTKIIDNGKGFSIEQAMEKKDKHFGLSIMYERVCLLNGKINIVSNLNEGTKIEITVPKP